MADLLLITINTQVKLHHWFPLTSLCFQSMQTMNFKGHRLCLICNSHLKLYSYERLWITEQALFVSSLLLWDTNPLSLLTYLIWCAKWICDSLRFTTAPPMYGTLRAFLTACRFLNVFFRYCSDMTSLLPCPKMKHLVILSMFTEDHSWQRWEPDM